MVEAVDAVDTQVELRETARSERPSPATPRSTSTRGSGGSSPAARTHMPRGSTSSRKDAHPSSNEGRAATCGTSTGTSTSSSAWAPAGRDCRHGYPAVVDAIAAQLPHGTNFVRPSRLELEAAETFLGLVTRADMVKFTKDGSTANTAAVKLARRFRRPPVALCVDHPFFSYDDWAMVATPVRGGIPASVEDLTLTFRYDDLASVEELLSRHPGEIACFILEPERASPPSEGYLQRLHELVAADGALLVLDENVSGFPWHTGPAQE